MVGARGFEPPTPCAQGRLAVSTVFSQLLPFVAITRFWGVCFRSQRLRLARLMGEFSDGFLTVVAAIHESGSLFTHLEDNLLGRESLSCHPCLLPKIRIPNISPGLVVGGKVTTESLTSKSV